METPKRLFVLGHHITPLETSGAYDIIMGQTPAGVPGPPPHYHRDYAELFVCLEGQMDFMIDGEKHTLKPGASINLPPGCLHTFSNPGAGPCKWINIHSPKGFWSFFERFGILDQGEGSYEKSMQEEIIGAVVQEATNYDMHIVMPEPAS